jgi:hypothetical protein
MASRRMRQRLKHMKSNQHVSPSENRTRYLGRDGRGGNVGIRFHIPIGDPAPLLLPAGREVAPDSYVLREE